MPKFTQPLMFAIIMFQKLRSCDIVMILGSPYAMSRYSYTAL